MIRWLKTLYYRIKYRKLIKTINNLMKNLPKELKEELDHAAKINKEVNEIMKDELAEMGINRFHISPAPGATTEEVVRDVRETLKELQNKRSKRFIMEA